MQVGGEAGARVGRRGVGIAVEPGLAVEPQRAIAWSAKRGGGRCAQRRVEGREPAKLRRKREACACGGVGAAVSGGETGCDADGCRFADAVERPAEAHRGHGGVSSDGAEGTNDTAPSLGFGERETHPEDSQEGGQEDARRHHRVRQP